MEWLRRNKTGIGLVVALIGVYVTQACPGLNYETCKYLSDALLSVGSFLAGAGILPSDYREKFVQGLVTIKKEEK